MTEALALEEASLDMPERAVPWPDMVAKQVALWRDTAAAVQPAGTAAAGAGPAPPAQVGEQQDTEARAVRPARRGVVGLGERRNDNLLGGGNVLTRGERRVLLRNRSPENGVASTSTGTTRSPADQL
jgi:hypothetical protein